MTDAIHFYERYKTNLTNVINLLFENSMNQLLSLKTLASLRYIWKYEMMDTRAAVLQLSSLAQEARLNIFRRLVQAGTHGLAAGSIGESLQIPASTLSFHLKELSHAGLVNARQDGRFVYYSANYATMNGLLAFLTENCCADESTSEADKTCATKTDCC